MKVILSNYRYFLSGGPERYLFSIKEMFEKRGIEIFPFSVKSKRNVKTKWDRYFLSPISPDESIYFREYKKGLKTSIKIIERSFYSPEGFMKARKYAKEISPNIVYSLHFLNKMSPSVIDGFKSVGLPVIVRLSDFGLICPQALLFHNDKICEECIGGSIFAAIRNKCVKNSVLGSFIKSLGLKFHQLIGSIPRIDAFVCPSSFTRLKYIEAGFPEEKLHCIPSFIDTSKIEPDYSYGEHILYLGRIVKEKGVDVLLEAYGLTNDKKPKLIVVGDTGETHFSKVLKEKYSKSAEFIDFLPKEEVYKYIRNAMFIVVPSVCYDNMPNVLLESFAHGKPVIASKHGCFPEIVEENHTGLLFNPGDVDALSNKLTWAIKHPKEVIEMGKNAREYAEKNFSPELHFESLIALFKTFF